MHLKNGDPKPTIKPNQCTLFGFRFCPYVDRVRMVLQYYNVPHDNVWIHLYSKPDWYLELYPVGKVPLLITKEGKTIVESDAIIRYLDETIGNKSLMSLCGEAEFERAGKLASKLMAQSHGILFGASVAEANASAYRDVCQEINDTIKGPYLLGDKLTLADFLLFSHVNHFEPIMARLDGLAPSDVHDLKATDQYRTKWPRLTTFLDVMRRLPCVLTVREPSQKLALFAETYRQGQPNPDL
uniref:Glutathione S-transferase omega class n=1 Tax=Fasciola hepatica TaxID=6192 RepID=K7YNB3_FASHE|nr:glutathione S-transferase omega class [Fasciola hepatica]